MVLEVRYLGHKINAEGLHSVADKTEAVQAAPVPTNVTELKSYLGLLSYYGKFSPNLLVDQGGTRGNQEALDFISGVGAL